MRSHLLSLVTLGLVMTSSAHAQVPATTKVARPPQPVTDPPDSALEASRLARRNLPKAAEVRAAVKADRRVAPLSSKIKAAFELRDKSQRKAALDALAPQILAIRSDIAKRFPPPDGAALTTLSPKEDPVLSRGPTGTPARTVRITTFPGEYTYKRDCPDGEDTWKLSKTKVSVAATSYPLENDCMTIRAGRFATVTVPPGTRTLVVKVAAEIHLEAFAAAFGIHAHAEARWGIRLHALNGAGLDSNHLGPVPVKVVNFRRVRARNFGGTLIPFDVSTFSDHTHEGDSGGASIGIDVPPSVGGSKVEVAVWTGGFVDADVTGVARIVNNLSIHSMTVLFLE